jgi:redox-sensitive bicupin YhaK (pirin superfamily)
MSYFDCPQPSAALAESEAGVAQVIVPRTADLGGFEVARALPSRERRTVGPFVFLDQMGLGVFAPGKGLDVRPHPHIGLSTVTYLYSGELLHRDSLDTRQTIRPGAVNWMTAGRGIAHSERTPDDLRAAGSELFGLQAWVALPEAEEECEPDFAHHPAESLPTFSDRGLRGRVLAGSAFGETAPVARADALFYADLALEAGAPVMIEPSHEERAVFVATGGIRIDGVSHPAGRLLVLEPGQAVRLDAETDSRIAVLGGEPLDGPRHVWWNFVSSRRDRIEQAKADWQAGRFDRVVDEHEWIPLPGS